MVGGGKIPADKVGVHCGSFASKFLRVVLRGGVDIVVAAVDADGAGVTSIEGLAGVERVCPAAAAAETYGCTLEWPWRMEDGVGMRTGEVEDVVHDGGVVGKVGGAGAVENKIDAWVREVRAGRG